MKRSIQEEEANEETENSSRLFLLSNQNKSLCLELARSKRAVAEARKELLIMRKKSMEMETLASLIQRTWSQLDIDASLLLDSLGDPVVVPEDNSSELLRRLIHAANRYTIRDPTAVEDSTKLSADEWSSNDEIEGARKRAESSLIEKQQEEEMDQQFGGPLEETLNAHSSFTLTLLERLCNAINESASLSSNETTVNALISTREYHAARLLWQDRVTKLTSETISKNAKILTLENAKGRMERKYDKAVARIKELEAQAVAHGDRAATSVEAAASDSSVEKELRRQIALLERQLAESETAKSKAEMTLTERLARPILQTETQVADLRKSMEELRQQCKHRVAALVDESEKHQAKIKSLEAAFFHLEAVSVARIEEVVAATEKEIAQVRAEKTALETQLYKAQADAAMAEQLQKTFSEQEAILTACNSEIKKLKEHLAIQNGNLQVLQTSLNNSRVREIAMEKLIQEKLSSLADAHAAKSNSQAEKMLTSMTVSSRSGDSASATLSSKSAGGSGSSNNNNNNNTSLRAGEYQTTDIEEMLDAVEVSCRDGKRSDSIDIISSAEAKSAQPEKKYQFLWIFKANQAQLKQNQERMEDMQAELEDGKRNINDLIMEIESVAAEESSARMQNSRLLAQIAESQSMQRGALEENLKLQNQLEKLKSGRADLEAGIELLKASIQQQETVMPTLRNAEQSARNELHVTKLAHTDLMGRKHTDEQSLQELQQKLLDSQYSAQAALKRNEELQSRCDELSSHCESERKAKMEQQRELSKLKAAMKKAASSSSSSSSSSATSSSSSSSSGSGSNASRQEDLDMLDMALGMLRCSVCKDRFKSAAITRCFHLFCKECIDENLRNRHRKCPACGEKFGQDDVRNIFFTH